MPVDEVKTKAMKGFLDTVGAKKAVVVTPEVNETVIKSARNSRISYSLRMSSLSAGTMNSRSELRSMWRRKRSPRPLPALACSYRQQSGEQHHGVDPVRADL